MQVFDRLKNTYYEDVQYGGGFLKKLYGTAVGRFFMPLILSRPISKIGGLFTDTALSRLFISKFISKNGIDMSEYEDRKYRSLNDLFSRKVKDGVRPICPDEDAFISPCDSKLSVYPVREGQKILIKGSEYSVPQLLEKEIGDLHMEDGICMVFRLSVDDYHRYCYPVSGREEDSYQVKGKLHTVCDISSKYKVFQENSRIVSILHTENMGNIIMIEVGALMVGRIVNHDVKEFSKGQEKGFFKLGGSTIVVIAPKDRIKLDDDISEHTGKGVEVKIRYGEKIGKVIR